MNSKLVLSFLFSFKTKVKKLVIFQNSNIVSYTQNFLNETFKEITEFQEILRFDCNDLIGDPCKRRGHSR